MAHEAELGLLARALAEQSRLGVGGRRMGVAPPLAMEVPLTVAAAGGRRADAILRAEALDRGPGLDQRAVDREVLATEEREPNVLTLGLERAAGVGARDSNFRRWVCYAVWPARRYPA
jgi:hypothetical protein